MAPSRESGEVGQAERGWLTQASLSGPRGNLGLGIARPSPALFLGAGVNSFRDVGCFMQQLQKRIFLKFTVLPPPSTFSKARG